MDVTLHAWHLRKTSRSSTGINVVIPKYQQELKPMQTSFSFNYFSYMQVLIAKSFSEPCMNWYRWLNRLLSSLICFLSRPVVSSFYSDMIFLTSTFLYLVLIFNFRLFLSVNRQHFSSCQTLSHTHDSRSSILHNAVKIVTRVRGIQVLKATSFRSKNLHAMGTIVVT